VQWAKLQDPWGKNPAGKSGETLATSGKIREKTMKNPWNIWKIWKIHGTSGWDFLDKSVFLDSSMTFWSPKSEPFRRKKSTNSGQFFPQLVTRVYHDDWDMGWNSVAGWVKNIFFAPQQRMV